MTFLVGPRNHPLYFQPKAAEPCGKSLRSAAVWWMNASQNFKLCDYRIALVGAANL
jgi:hypothetical protein